MPNTVTVKAHADADLVVIRKARKGSHGYTMGTVMLKNVTVNVDSVTGDWLAEFTEARELGTEALSHLKSLTLTARGYVLTSELESYIEALDTWIEADTDTEEPAHPVTVAGNTYRAAYACGQDLYVG